MEVVRLAVLPVLQLPSTRAMSAGARTAVVRFAIDLDPGPVLARADNVRRAHGLPTVRLKLCFHPRPKLVDCHTLRARLVLG